MIPPPPVPRLLSLLACVGLDSLTWTFFPANHLSVPNAALCDFLTLLGALWTYW